MRKKAKKGIWQLKHIPYRQHKWKDSDIIPTLSGFKRWLKSLPEHEFVGISNDPLSCPLGQFVYEGKWSIPRPEWASRFAVLLDTFFWPHRYRKVNARICLRIIEHMEKEQYMGVKLEFHAEGYEEEEY